MAETPEPSRARSRRSPFVRALLVWLALWLFFGALALFASFYDRFPADERLARSLQDIDVPAFGGFLNFVNFLGNRWTAVALTLVLTFGFATLRAGSEATLVLLTLIPRAANEVLKGWVERARPSDELVDVTAEASGFSFPSGHTVGTAALLGVLFFLIPAVVPWRALRWTLQLGCLLMVAAAGPARVYEGVHWPSDVFAAYLLALLLLTPVVAVYLLLKRQPKEQR